MIVDRGRLQAARAMLLLAGPGAVVCGACAIYTIASGGPIPWLLNSLLFWFAVLGVCIVLSWRVDNDLSWSRVAGVPRSRMGMLLRGLETLFVLLVMQSFAVLWRGGPDEPTATCPYPLNSHGVITCVSAAEHAAAGAAMSRLFAAGFTLAFLSVISIGLRGLEPVEAPPAEHEIRGDAPRKPEPPGARFN